MSIWISFLHCHLFILFCLVVVYRIDLSIAESTLFSSLSLLLADLLHAHAFKRMVKKRKRRNEKKRVGNEKYQALFGRGTRNADS